MSELSLIQKIERIATIARGIEAYKRLDIVQKDNSEDFISERTDIKKLVLQLHAKYYSRYLEKPTIEVIA